MTGDRHLHPHEMQVFMQHGSIGFNTIKETLFTGGEPTLFEVAFIEIMAKIDAHTDNIINQGAEIKVLRAALGAGGIIANIISLINTHKVRLDEFDGSIGELKKLLTEQIDELRQMKQEIDAHEA